MKTVAKYTKLVLESKLPVGTIPTVNYLLRSIWSEGEGARMSSGGELALPTGDGEFRIWRYRNRLYLRYEGGFQGIRWNKYIRIYEHDSGYLKYTIRDDILCLNLWGRIEEFLQD